MSLRKALLVVALAAALPTRADIDRETILVRPELRLIVPVRPMPTNADPANPNGPEDVITQRNNNLRTGTVVTSRMNQQTVGERRFGYIGRYDVDGAVLAQPLFMESVQTRQGRRSVVFIATATNWVYAFNAEPPFQKLWERQLAEPYRRAPQDNDPTCQELLSTTEQEEASGQRTLYMGVESTPAIDPQRGLLYVSYRADQPGAFGTQRLAALRVADGSIANAPSGPMDRVITDNRDWNALHRNRASLLIDDGVVYVAFAGRCENPEYYAKRSYQGWIYAFDADTLNFAGRFRSTQTPGHQVESTDPISGGGIWMAGTGLAADGHGNLYFATGNAMRGAAPPDPQGLNLSNSVVRVEVTRGAGSGAYRFAVTMTAKDWFTPYRKLWQDWVDLDFGSAGVLLIPNTRYLLAGGKEGMLYVLDRNQLGKFDATPAFDPNTVYCHQKTTADAVSQDDPARDRAVQKLRIASNQYCDAKHTATYCFGSEGFQCPKYDAVPANGLTMDDWISWPHIHGTPVFGVFGDGQARVYIWPEKDHLKSLTWWGGGLDSERKVATALPANDRLALAPPYLKGLIGAVGMPGGMLSLAVDPAQPAGGVLFASVQRCRKDRDDPSRDDCSITRCTTAELCREQKFGMLRAFDPITLRELWNNQLDAFSEGNKDYWFAKFVPPTIAKGRVYLATQSRRVLIYGVH